MLINKFYSVGLNILPAYVCEQKDICVCCVFPIVGEY